MLTAKADRSIESQDWQPQCVCVLGGEGVPERSSSAKSNSLTSVWAQ